MLWRNAVASVFTALLWIGGQVTGEKDSNDCIFYYWQVDWHTAVKTCKEDHKTLLCYKSKKEIDDYTENFRLAAVGSARLTLWLSSKNCSTGNEMEECLSLHIQKTEDGVWHYFQQTCEDEYPFICCVNGTAETTTSTDYLQTTNNRASDTFESVSGCDDCSLATITPTSSSVRPPFCKRVRKRGIIWPDTDTGVVAVRPCPGNSTGEASWECEQRNVSRWKESGPDLTKCRSREIQNLKERFNTTSATAVISELKNIFEDRNKEVFGEDLADVILLMTALPDRLFQELDSLTGSSKWTSTEESVDKVMSVVDRIMDLKSSWHDIEKREKSVVGTNLLLTVEEMGSLLASSLPENLQQQSIIGKNMALQVLRPRLGESISLPQWMITSHYSHRGNVVLEKGYDSQLAEDGGNISLVFALYADMSCILSQAQGEANNRSSSLNSAVLSTSVSQGRKSVKINNEVRIVLEHLTPNPNETACVFWNMERDLWDTSGCRLESSNGSYSVCLCNHLTNFAILMDHGDILSDVDQLPFHYITVIGCSLSILSLAICVIIFSCYSYHSRHSWGLRYAIHRNLCLTLLIANVVLVFGLDRTENQRACSIIAGLLHYFFLSAFSWMLLEGVHIYLLLVVVFASRKSHSEKYYLFGYGFPLLIVMITALSRPTYYGTDEVCWLSSEKGTIWGFMGPVAAILVLNTAALILAQYKASRISIKDDKVALFKRWLRVTLILFPVLGITWVFGFLYLGKHFEVAGYLFAIFNSLQGVCIFVFHCLLDKKARNMVMDSFKKKNSSINTGSSGTQKKKEHHNGIKSNSITPLENDENASSKLKTFQIAGTKKSQRDWSKWHKPWSFCFDMPVSDKNSKKEQDKPPQAVVVHWHSLKDKNCI